MSKYKDAKLLTRPGGFRDCPECPLMIMLPAGKYKIGSPPDEFGRRDNEGPQKEIRFTRPFTVSRYEILRKEFAAFVSASRYRPSRYCGVNGKLSNDHDWQKPGIPQTDRHPVVCITWKDASAYVDWLSRKTKRTYRLLTESEWEYAARAGAETPYITGLRISVAEANYDNTKKGTAPTGYSKQNKFGLFDVAGNVWEMVEDCWSEDMGFIRSNGTAVRLMGDCGRRSIRGGGWASDRWQVRFAYRANIGINGASNAIGMRVAREIQ